MRGVLALVGPAMGPPATPKFHKIPFGQKKSKKVKKRSKKSQNMSKYGFSRAGRPRDEFTSKFGDRFEFMSKFGALAGRLGLSRVWGHSRTQARVMSRSLPAYARGDLC